MPLQWDPRLETGVEEIDRQHKKLVAIVNRLEAAIAANEGGDVIYETIDDLNKYALYHFRTEEEFMHKHDYPDTDKHAFEHTHFKKKMLLFNFKPDDAACSSEYILHFLTNWITHHIGASDKDLGSFVKASS